MMQFLSSRRFLAAYSGFLTVLFPATLLWGFGKTESKQSFDEITVHRINVVERDGTIRMVLTNKASAPGDYIKNKEYPRPDRKTAGLLFFDDRERRMAVLAMASLKTKAGNWPAAMRI
jgi:hypothetical protein